jgi:hypothetical protein
MINLPTPYAAARIAAFLQDHQTWSAYWDKQRGTWQVAEDDPHSALQTESTDADTVIVYMTAHTLPSHPLYALTTYELAGYRRELERALSQTPDTAPDRNLLRARLADVLIEEKSRTRLSEANSR